MPGLSVSDLIRVDVQLSPTAAQTSTNFDSLLLLGSSSVIDTDQRLRSYSSIDGVSADFGTSAEEYKAALNFYSQVPQPRDLYIGKWNQTASAGLLYGSALSPAQQLLSVFTAVSTGGMKITIDGTLKTLSALDFSGATTLNGVATIVTTALASSATMTWDAANKRFQVKSATTGATSTVAFAIAPATGTDISTLLGLKAADGGKVVDGVAAESMLDAVTILSGKSNDWFGLSIAVAAPADADILAVAAFVEASPRMFFVTAQSAAVLDSTSTTDLAYVLSAAKYNRTAVQYSPSPYAAVSLAARQMSVNFSAPKSTITLAYKSEPGVTASTLSETEFAAARAKNANVFVNFSNNTAIILDGKVASGQYVDSIVGLSWLRAELQNTLFNALYTSTTKIDQDDAGVNVLISTAHQVMDSSVANGLVAPGVWTGPLFGGLQLNQTLTAGYYIYAAPVAFQSAGDRAARKSPPLQIAVKLGGAIHSVDATLSVVQ